MARHPPPLAEQSKPPPWLLRRSLLAILAGLILLFFSADMFQLASFNQTPVSAARKGLLSHLRGSLLGQDKNRPSPATSPLANSSSRSTRESRSLGAPRQPRAQSIVQAANEFLAVVQPGGSEDGLGEMDDEEIQDDSANAADGANVEVEVADPLSQNPVTFPQDESSASSSHLAPSSSPSSSLPSSSSSSSSSTSSSSSATSPTSLSSALSPESMPLASASSGVTTGAAHGTHMDVESRSCRNTTVMPMCGSASRATAMSSKKMPVQVALAPSRCCMQFADNPCFGQQVVEAEAVYEKHLDRRLQALGGCASMEDAAAAGAIRDMQTLIALVLAPTYPCVREERFGLWGEGGKWVCRVPLDEVQSDRWKDEQQQQQQQQHQGEGRRGLGQEREEAEKQQLFSASVQPLHHRPVVVSIGSKGEVSFEKSMFETFGSKPHTFDPFLNRRSQSVLKSRRYLNFYPLGLAGSEQLQLWLAQGKSKAKRMLTVPQLLGRIGAPYVDVLKIDCEGCEYGVVEDLEANYTRKSQPFGQVLMEVHDIGRRSQFVALFLALERMGYRLFHAEENVYCSHCYELAWIHESVTGAAALQPVREANGTERRGRGLMGGVRSGVLFEGAPAPALPAVGEIEAAGAAAVAEAVGNGVSASPPAPAPAEAPGDGRSSCARVIAEGAASTLRAHMQRAEVRQQLERKRSRHASRLPRFPVMVETSLLPLASCPLKQRIGPWGPGGAWFCWCAGSASRESRGGDGGGRGPMQVVFVGLTADCLFESGSVTVLGATFYSIDPKTAQEEFLSARATQEDHTPPPSRFTSPVNNSLGERVPHDIRSEAIISKMEEICARHGARRLALMKLDCAGCEFALVAALRDAYNRTTVPIAQMSVVLHNLKNVKQVVAIMSTLDDLGFRPFQSHRVGATRTEYELTYVHEACAVEIQTGHL